MSKKRIESRQRAAEAESRRQSARAQVRQAWQQAQPQSGLTLRVEDVYVIAWRLIEMGVQPTNEAVRFVHGSGSPNMIAPALRSFFAGELQRRYSAVSTPTLSSEALAAWAVIQREAEDLARSRLVDEQSRLDAQSAALAAQKEALNRREQIQEERDLQQHKIQEGWTATRQDVERRIAEWQSDRDNLRRDAEAFAAQGQRIAQERVRQLENEIEALCEQLRRCRSGASESSLKEEPCR